MRIVVLGYIVRGPLGGMVWSNLQFLRGLARLGHQVYFIEDSDDYPSCYDPIRGVIDDDPSYGLTFAAAALAEAGFSDRWAYFDARSDTWFGPCADRAQMICQTAELVLNLCGINPIRAWLEHVPLRVLVDEDPAFTQIRHLTDPQARRRAEQHNRFFTFAGNVGTPECRLPDDGYPWQATRQPVVLDSIAEAAGRRESRFTTVMQWSSYHPVTYMGIHYGMKSDSFGPYIDLPGRVSARLELAIAGASVPKQVLMDSGWSVVDAIETTITPLSYAEYIQHSKAEFSLAKQGYVISQSGWFSERSVTYLTTGRPVVVQDTGFSQWLEGGAGVLPFADPDQAAAAIEDVEARYDFHRRSALDIAVTYFDSDRVLGALLDKCFESDLRRPKKDRHPVDGSARMGTDMNREGG
jgi:hypothetical protein